MPRRAARDKAVIRPPGPDVLLPRPLAKAIAAHARAERPNEACGLVIGTAHAADGGEARRYVPCRNQLASPSRYLVHRDDLLAVLAEIDRAGEELWAVVHSHVRTEAVPSRSDVDEAAWPAAVYLLVSLADDADDADDADGADDADDDGEANRAHRASGVPSLRAWWIADGAARELTLRIVEDVP